MKSSLFLAGTALALAIAGAGCGKRSSGPAATAAADAAASSSVASAGLSVCIDSSSSVSTMGRKLAEAVAQAQGVTLGVHEFDGSGSDDEGFEMKNFVTLAGGECQLVLGFPLRNDDAGGLPAGLRVSAPYGHTGYVLVTPTDAKAHALDTLPAGTNVAVTFQTMPNTYFVNYPKLKADVRLSDKAAIQALESGEVQAAMLWRPAVTQQLIKDGQAQRFAYTELTEPHARYNLVALYADANAGTARKFTASVERLEQGGQLAALLEPYGALPGKAMAPREPPPALYAVAQATRGKTGYEDHCALCHGPDLTGRAGPALKGRHFAPDSGKFKVKDIFTIVHKNMPAMAPGSLPKETYVEIMAYLLQQNGYPDGKKPLNFNAADASDVPLIYAGQ